MIIVHKPNTICFGYTFESYPLFIKVVIFGGVIEKIIKRGRSHITQCKFFFLRIVDGKLHIVSRTFFRDIQFHKGFEYPFAAHIVGKYTLIGGHEAVRGISTQQIVKVGRAAAPMTDDKNRRFLEFVIPHLFSEI
jgi:hypothetical protein